MLIDYGLATLYQLRGRVGRSNKLSFCYITYTKNKQVSELAEKRLKTIRDFTEFGSGYKIALRDLEIRGAGNILGSSQSGHIAAIGYDLYLSMLNKATNNINTISHDVKIDLPISAYIPDKYINSLTNKITMYHKISECNNNDDILKVIDELLDKYGKIPDEVNNLLNIVNIRNMATKLNIDKIYIKLNYLYFKGKDTVLKYV
ncbi:MAG: TRCF domain-containing protein, partial [Clostridia bacterium]